MTSSDDNTNIKTGIKFSSLFQQELEDRVEQRTRQLTFEIDELARAEVKISELARFPEENPSPVLRAHRNGVLLYANAASAHIIKTLNCTVGDTLPDDWCQVLSRVFNKKSTMEIERKYEGRIFSFLMISVMADDYVNIYGRDITKRREMERSLRHTQKMESLGSLSGGIAHDINNMLVPIINLTSSAIKTLPKSRKERQYLASVIKAAEQIKSLVKKILAFSRQEKDDMTNINPCHIVHDVVELMHSAMPEAITIQQKIDDNIGAIYADKSQIVSVLVNLISNSIDAMDGQTGKLGIFLSVIEVGRERANKPLNLKYGKYAKLVVSDTGKGMDEATMNRVFDPFFTTKAVGKGTGMGLSIVYGIIINHNGVMDIASTPEKGTTVTIYLPLVGEDIMANGEA